MYRFLVSVATPSGLRKWYHLEAADFERAAHSARTQAKGDPDLRKHLLRITTYQPNTDQTDKVGPLWIAVFGLIDTGDKLHSGNL